MVNVERLSLYLTKVTRLDALAAMMELRALDLGRAHHVESLAPIAGKSKLEELTIWSSPVKDLNVLLTLDSLAKLWVHPRQLSSELHGALVEKNPELEIVEWSYME